MKPWPESYFGQLELHEGMLERAEELFEHAFALGRQYDDPCFKAKGSTGLGLLAAERGDVDAAAKLLQEAQMYLIRTPDHTWTLAYALDALCKVAARYRLPEAPRWINDLEALAGRTGLREFVAWSYLYRYELGDRGALETAELLASEMESPFVHQAIRAATMTV
jgi:tetratricopeptide (TPR) repeat protein